MPADARSDHVSRLKVSLFVTCVVDTLFPEVGEATVRMLRRAGCQVDFPPGQVCCGQPAFNAGYHSDAARVARALIDAFAGAAYVVTPSGSCAAMVRHFYPTLFRDDAGWTARAGDFAGRVYEFSEFFVRVLGLTDVGARWKVRATYHSSCHMRRGLGLVEEPLALLRAVRDLELVDLPHAEDCCGFGGTFAVKLPEISQAMADEKLSRVADTGAELLVGSDMACLMHMGGRLSRLGSPVRVMHTAQVLEEGLRR